MAEQPEAKGKPPIDWTVMHAQVILDRLGFSPGIIDGREGQSLTAALKGFQETRGLTTSGELDRATLGALHQYREWRPAVKMAVPDAALQGFFVNPVPKDPEAQAKLPSIGYSRPLEKMGEMFHTTPEVLVEMNPCAGKIECCAVFLFPKVASQSRDYKIK